MAESARSALALGALLSFLLGLFLASPWLGTGPLDPFFGYGIGCLALLGFRCVASDGSPWRLAGWPSIAIYGVCLVPWALFTFGLYPRLLRLLDYDLVPQPQVLDLVHASGEGGVRFWLAVGVAVFLGPLAEEVMFRGYLRNLATSVLPQWAALVSVSVLFGCVHQAMYAVPLTLLGLVFGWLRERSGGLATPIIAHQLHNGLTVLLSVYWPDCLDWLYR